MKLWFFFLLLTSFAYGATDKLRVFDDRNFELVYSSSDPREIASQLNRVSILFEQWQAEKSFDKDAAPEVIFDAYQTEIEKLKLLGGYRTVDIVKMHPDSPKKAEVRNKFLNEHTHSEDEVRFFVEGSGLFYLHLSDKVYIVLCEQGDLISIPAGVAHWFDMGDRPYFTAIRFFIEPSGWIAQFTGSGISDSLPRFD